MFTAKNTQERQRSRRRRMIGVTLIAAIATIASYVAVSGASSAAPASVTVRIPAIDEAALVQRVHELQQDPAAKEAALAAVGYDFSPATVSEQIVTNPEAFNNAFMFSDCIRSGMAVGSQARVDQCVTNAINYEVPLVADICLAVGTACKPYRDAVFTAMSASDDPDPVSEAPVKVIRFFLRLFSETFDLCLHGYEPDEISNNQQINDDAASQLLQTFACVLAGAIAFSALYLVIWGLKKLGSKPKDRRMSPAAELYLANPTNPSVQKGLGFIDGMTGAVRADPGLRGFMDCIQVYDLDDRTFATCPR